MEKITDEQISQLYNLILNPATRAFEREALVATKVALADYSQSPEAVFSKLEAKLRPLALRNNLTPDLADFYAALTGESVAVFDYEKHQAAATKNMERAIFAGGCFWCMVEPFELKAGIQSVLSGYTGGTSENPTYEQVLSGLTGHTEAVEIIYDPEIISYEELVELYWKVTDPTDAFGQFQDRGSQYRPVIFVLNESQRIIAEESKKQLAEKKKYHQPIVTQIETAGSFFPAENYHQQFYRKNPKRYRKMEQARQQYLSYQKARNKVYQTFGR